MTKLTEKQSVQATMSLSDEILKLVEQTLFEKGESTERGFEIATFALCRAMGTVIGSASADKEFSKRVLRGMEPLIIGFAESMRKGMEQARSDMR